MTSDFASQLSSDIVQLLAQGESRFLVHEDILVAQSKPFHDALTGEWKEATERKINLQDWDGATVGRLVEFLYRGSYTPLNPAAIPLTVSGSLTPTMPSTGNSEAEIVRLEGFNPAQYDYKEALLSHAKVYQLAHYKAIDPLQVYALELLRQTLRRIDPINPAKGAHNIVGVFELARNVYANTDHLENHVEPLRSLVSNFIARNFSALQSAPEMVHFLGEGGAIVLDVMATLSVGLPMAIHPRPISSPTRYVSKLLVVIGPERDMPHDYLRELNGSTKHLNWPGSRDTCAWLYARYSKYLSEACTRFEAEAEPRGSEPPYSVLIAPHRRVLQYRDSAVRRKITTVMLLRASDPVEKVSDIPLSHNTYDGMSTDLNTGRPGGYLYIIWKSVLLD